MGRYSAYWLESVSWPCLPVVRVAVVSVTAWRVTRAVCGCHVSRAVLGSLTITFPAIAWASLQLVSWEMVPSLPRSWPGPTLKRISCGPITNKNFYLHCSINRVFSAWKGGEDIKHAAIRRWGQVSFESLSIFLCRDVIEGQYVRKNI